MNFDSWGHLAGSEPPQSPPESERGKPVDENNNSSQEASAAAAAAAPAHDDEESDNHDILNWVFSEDGRLVGTDAIFTSSPNVSPHHSSNVDSNQHKRMGIPTPSIYTDDRGEIHNIKANDKRINILYTKKGYLRSGDLHPNEQFDFIFSGKIKIWTLQSDGCTKITNYGANDFIRIPRGVPHVFEFVEDTVLAEWWDPPGFQAWFYKPYRDIVNEMMGVRESGEGVGVGGNGNGRQKGLEILVSAGDNRWNTVKVLLGAAFVGCLGFAVGRRGR